MSPNNTVRSRCFTFDILSSRLLYTIDSQDDEGEARLDNEVTMFGQCITVIPSSSLPAEMR